MASSERTEGAPATPATAAATGSGAERGAQAPGANPRQSTAEPTPGQDWTGRASGTATTEAALIDGLRCELLMNSRYHASREAFLDTVHRVLMFFIIVLGAAAVTELFGVGPIAHLIKGGFAAVAVIFAAVDLTADLSNRARCHALMKRRYFEMLAELVSGPTRIREIEAQMHRCSADEEPAFHALLATCWNAAQEMVYGDASDAYKIPMAHRFMKNIRRYGQIKYPTIPRSRTAVG